MKIRRQEFKKCWLLKHLCEYILFISSGYQFYFLHSYFLISIKICLAKMSDFENYLKSFCPCSISSTEQLILNCLFILLKCNLYPVYEVFLFLFWWDLRIFLFYIWFSGRLKYFSTIIEREVKTVLNRKSVTSVACSIFFPQSEYLKSFPNWDNCSMSYPSVEEGGW